MRHCTCWPHWTRWWHATICRTPLRTHLRCPLRLSLSCVTTTTRLPPPPPPPLPPTPARISARSLGKNTGNLWMQDL
ncbi:hypothetical protein LSTR_LSTR016323 [Laodelphax striatellus]|uniref:Uncharacterized protein n=1 Tax=Laodelphax striatellus TaxID=195883 RepID=A0A482X208_LAOST|nr:hypothetical protein LSTR_LSTR016323 [Laodelphax striatellus]